ncbi:hypothetical protein [Parendozoicomonas haliclonae]|uniref:Uncharacterized protein n=1 Tax=Parendozoicomonas haliclonae TaxID=1960125 RepID=A0A1X7ALQ3_9GAMM|nr:hypothetical protein [Parendozoicomonas haliclonae]SMA46263.1 hypothetical protein EHSB41UT_02115 [Parendozoicomonas haliclonae]
MDVLSPETVFAKLQEKNQDSGISVGELLLVPMGTLIHNLTVKIDQAFQNGIDENWLACWFDEGKSLLEGMPAIAFLGPEHSAGHNAYAIIMAAMMKAALKADDVTMAEACCTLDLMHTVSLPLFNLAHPKKQVQPVDKALYSELERITLKQMQQLLDRNEPEAKELLGELGWKPLMRSGDEGWKIMHAREFLGLFFSGQLDIPL